MIEISEETSLATYRQLADQWTRDMERRGQEKRATIAQEMELNNPQAQRYIARNNKIVAGFMVIYPKPDSIFISGICTHDDSNTRKGVLKALVTLAVNISLQTRRLGEVTLHNFADDDGAAYRYLGFVGAADDHDMRLSAAFSHRFKWANTPQLRIGEKGQFMQVTELKLAS